MVCNCNDKQGIQLWKDNLAMNKLKTTIALGLLVVIRVSIASSLEEAFVSLYNEMKATNATQSAFMDAVLVDRFRWFNLYRATRNNISDDALSEWYANLAAARVPDNVEASGTNLWLKVKQYAIADMSFDTAVCNSTSCWFAIAREHGVIRSGLRSASDWEALLGIDQSEREVMPDGVVIVSVPGLFGDQHRQRESMVRQMKEVQFWNEELATGMRCALKNFAKSACFTSLSQPERNSIVSNLVEAAHLTQEESASLGLTNMVESVSQ